MIRFINILSLITLTLLVGCGVATPRTRGDNRFSTSPQPPLLPNPIPLPIPLPIVPPLGFRCTIAADKTEVVPGMSVRFTVRAAGAPVGATYTFESLRSSINGNQSLIPVANTLTAEANVIYTRNELGDDIVEATVRNSIDSSSVSCLRTVVVKELSLELSANKLTELNSTSSIILVTALFSGLTSPSFSYSVTSSTSTLASPISVSRNGLVFTVRPRDNKVHNNVILSVTARDGSSEIRAAIGLSFLPALTANVNITTNASTLSNIVAERPNRIGSEVTFTVVATTNGVIGEIITSVLLANSISFREVGRTPNSVTVIFQDTGTYDNSNFARITVTSALRPNETFNNTPGSNSNILTIPRFIIN